jgi:hypothetical protein
MKTIKKLTGFRKITVNNELYHYRVHHQVVQIRKDEEKYIIPHSLLVGDAADPCNDCEPGYNECKNCLCYDWHYSITPKDIAKYIENNIQKTQSS